VASDPSVRGSVLLDFQREKCMKLPKSQGPDSQSSYGPLISNHQEPSILEVASLEAPKCRRPKVPKCRN
jgi:hypothetical protein